MKTSTVALVATGAMACAGVFLVDSTNAADHLDAPGTSADPAADINDVFVFRSQDPAATTADRTVFVMTVFPNAGADARFSDAVEYKFLIEDAEDADNDFDITCTATAGMAQMITCNGPSGATDTVAFDAVEPGDANADAMRVFAGLRDDPFFFDLTAFLTVQSDPDEVGLLLDDEGTDFVGGFNTLAIVVDVDNSIFGASTQLKYYAVTERM